jgi:outer membrane protein TolC
MDSMNETDHLNFIAHSTASWRSMNSQSRAREAAGRTATIACVGLIAVISMLQPTRLLAQETSAEPPLALSLRDAVRMALSPQGDPSIGVAEESVKIAEAQFREARAGARPQIDASVGGANQVINLAALGLDEIQLPIPGFSFPQAVGPFNTLVDEVHVKQELIDMPSVRRSKALQAGITTAKDQTDEVRDQTATNVAKLYLAAVKASNDIDLAKARVEWAETTLRDLTNRDAEGKALDIDVSHARMRVASEQQQLIQAESDREGADLDLLNALNLSLDRPINLTESLASIPQETLSPADAVAIALKSRSEIVTQKQRIEAGSLSNKSIRSERFPSLSGYADMGSSGTSAPSSVGIYDVGIALNIPIFDGGRRASREAEGLGSLRQDELREKQLEKQVELQVRQALLKLDAAKGRVETSTKQFEVAQEDLDHRRRLVEQGLGGETEVADARLALAQAEDGRLAALYTWNEAHIELLQAMGTIRSLAQ